MEAYGFTDWEGNDRHFMGWAGTGVHFDPVIADNAARVAAGQRRRRSTQPWFLTVALVNPHDVMWFPIDQPWYDDAHPDEARVRPQHPRGGQVEGRRDAAAVHRRLRRGRRRAARQLRRRPAHQARRATRSGAGTSSTGCGATSTRPTRRRGSATSTTTSSCTSRPTSRSAPCSRALEASRRRGTTRSSSSRPTTATCAARTGCGRRARSSTTRSCACRCTCGCPGVTDARVADRRAGDATSTSPRRSARSPASTVARRVRGRRPLAVLRRPGASVRDHVLFAHDTAHTPTRPPHPLRDPRLLRRPLQVRPLLRRRRRHPGRRPVGKPTPQAVRRRRRLRRPGPRVVRPRRGPHELVNLAGDRSRRGEVREWFARLKELSRKGAEL